MEDAQNAIYETYKKQGRFREGNKKDTYTYQQKDIIEISRAHNKEKGLGKSDTHRAD